MLKNATKTKKVHWIPPPGRTCKDKTGTKENLNNVKALPKRSVLKSSVDNCFQSLLISKLNMTYVFEKSDNDSATAVKSLCFKEGNVEISSASSSHLFEGNKHDSSIFLSDTKQEHKILYLYYMSLRPVLQKLKRLIANVNIHDDTIQEQLSKVEVELNNLFGFLEDLEYSISLFENALSGTSPSESILKIVETKESLLKKLFDCYHGILAIFLVVLEESSSYDAKKLEKEREDFIKRYQVQEKKHLSQAAILKDLERQLSILQGKYRAVEGYNTTLEETKTEFQNMIHDKDIQIRKLTSEMAKSSLKQDDEKWIVLMEEIKVNAQTEKKALKRAVKSQKLFIQDIKQEMKELEEEKEKKGKMLVNLAAERDKLRVQLTVANNELVQARYQIEEIKSQKLNLQNKLSEKEMNFKSQLLEESKVFEKQLQEKENNELKLKTTVKNLEEELSATVKELEVLKSRHDSIKASLLQAQNEHSVDKVFDEVKSLTSLLQDAKEHFQTVRNPDVMAAGDSSLNGKNSTMENVVAMMQDMKRELLEIKKDGAGNQHDKSSESDLLMQLEELKQKHKALSEENSTLKQQLKEIENMSTFSQYARDENYPAESNFPYRDFHTQIQLKNEELWKYKQRERKLEYELQDIKDKLQKKEMENVRIFSLEESLKRTEGELKTKTRELSLLEQKKLEESERLLKRTKDLQEALDESNAKNELLTRHIDMLKESERLLKRTKDLQEALDESNAKNELLTRHIDMLKVSLYNVFGES